MTLSRTASAVFALACAVAAQACCSATSTTSDAAIARAQALLQPGQPAALQAHASARDTFTVRRAEPLKPDQVGQFHIRFDRAYQGVPVAGGDIIVHLMPDGTLTNVTTTLSAPLNLATVTPRMQREQALSQALESFRKKGREDSTNVELMVAAWTMIAPAPTLTWRVEVVGAYCQHPSRMQYWFDAMSGQLLNRHDEQESLVPMTCKD
jgi:zinc metalloprotease ZmpA